MITSLPDKNMELTFEQLEQLDAFNIRLSKLEHNIRTSSKELNILSKEVIKATREREYQEELHTELLEKIKIKQAEFSSLEKSVLQMETSIANTRKEEGSIKESLAKEKAELDDRDQNIVSAEQELSKKQEAFRVENTKQIEDRKLLDNAFEAFSEALKKITWKFNKE